MVKSAIEKVQSLPPAEGKAGIQRQDLLARAFFAQGMINLSKGYLLLSKQALHEAISISRAIGNKNPWVQPGIALYGINLHQRT